MNTPLRTSGPEAPVHPNGSGAAALLSAGIGSFALAVLAIAADQSKTIQGFMKFYKPTGPLSGVTTTAIVVWLLCWIVLDLRWRHNSVDLKRIGWAAFALLALGFLLTFPPIADLF
jgi:hypothetical protein